MSRSLVLALSLTVLLALSGCCAQGLMEEPEPITPIEIATPEPATPAPDPVSPLEKILSESQMESLKGAKDDLKAASSDVQFAAVYRALKELSDDLEPTLQAEFDKKDQMDLPGGLFEDFPFFEVRYGAEGTAVIVAMTYPPLREAAGRTSAKSDDRFVDALEAMYTNAAGEGWSSIEDLNTDVSGCSPLGSGVHKGILLDADHALVESDIFDTEIQAIRDPVIKDITIGNEQFFPYCDASTSKKTLNPKIRGEINSILEECKLSDSERKQLENAMNVRFAIKVGGGGGGGVGPRGKRK